MLKCFDLTGEVAIVTGASKGLGEGFAKALAKSGADVFLIARNENRLKKVAEDIRKIGRKCKYAIADISDENSIKEAADKAYNYYGKIDILVNNAALMRDNRAPQDIPPEDYNKVLFTNIVGAMICSNAFGKYMIQKQKGKIVNVSSISSKIVNKGVHGGSYEVSKAGLTMLSRTLATEWAKYNINVNTVMPGYFGTQPNKEFFDNDPEFYDTVIDMIPMGRLGLIEELAGAVVFLSSPAANYMQGTEIIVDGGYTIW